MNWGYRYCGIIIIRGDQYSWVTKIFPDSWGRNFIGSNFSIIL